MNSAYSFFKSNSDLLPGKVVLLYDCDTKKTEEVNDEGNVIVQCMVNNPSNTIYTIGVENLLVLPADFPFNDFYKIISKKDGYGAESSIHELDKTKLCDHICCDLPLEGQKKILINLKKEFDRIAKIIK
ncbi:MAG: hypothetical protein M0P01_11285 [Treponema sp.]|nr:hypothetical protein [Treponema sp.]